MSEPPREAIPISGPRDTPEHIAEDVLCKQCGYNLRTLSTESVCPECGTAVRHSLVGFYLRFAPLVWVRRVRRGLSILILSILLQVLAGLVVAAWVVVQTLPALSSGPPPSGGLPFDMQHTVALGTLLGIPVAVLQIVGLLLLTARNPEQPPDQGPAPVRVWIRRSLWLYAAAPLLSWAMVLPESLIGAESRTWLAVISQPVETAALAVVAVLLCRHLGQLMARVPRPGLVQYARVVFWGFLISVGVLVFGQVLNLSLTGRMMGATQGFLAMPGTPTTATTTTAVTSQSATAPAVSETALPAGRALTTAPTALLRSGGVPFWLGQIVAGTGGCAYVGFAVAGFVLLLLARAALDRLLREAKQNARAENAQPDRAP